MGKDNLKTPHEMLLDKGFKGMRSERDINIAAIVAQDYADLCQTANLAKIKELEAQNKKLIDELFKLSVDKIFTKQG